MNPRLDDWRGKRAWLVGASTGIGAAVASALHARGAAVYLSARGMPALEAFAVRHPGSVPVPADVTDAAAVQAATRVVLDGGPLDMVLYCAGHYKPLRATAFDLQEMLRHQQVNYVGALHVLDAVLPHMLHAHRGHLSLVSSVAGWRGMPQSLGYGPTKAALMRLAETLYMDLHAQGLGVSLVNPGFVETPLTANNDFRMPALIQPEEAARQVLRGWTRGSFDIQFPKRFTVPLKLATLLPFGIYQALARRVTGL
ncbi:SDR family NAD(P)-dependent oxidoreductase [Ramlibacter sp.]|uniref:SDR family NAD(P)-dependent oxidoreductase n=1 Tax=Ramlibacter sp. TaxID=1917967 RepID=UPI0018279EE4|nr:SDR family NAD(P)-dependent oxidoreductase [Ramlibacter sp.]MBA2674785.1 SDR family NAD(P)-dependent oxidoreductase [Ramlibacter sp.]